MSQFKATTASLQGGSMPEPGSFGENEQALSRAKRQIRELEDANEELRGNKEAKRSKSTDIVKKGRAFRRVISLFDNPVDLVHEYDRRAEISDQLEDNDSEDQTFPHSPGHNHLYRGFQEFIGFFPWIKSKLTDCEPDELEALLKELRRGGDQARGDDASGLKKEVLNWLINLYAPIIPPISPRIKADRGLEHDITGRLLCPIEYNWDDAEVRKNIRERHPQFLVTEDSWPRFLYDTGYQYDPNNIEKGLFRSTLLLKAFKQIFTSPSSAHEAEAGEYSETRRQTRLSTSDSDKSTRSHVASLIGMRSVKPRAIAYSAVQLRFALSSLTCWRMIDGDFAANTFYQSIVTYFEAPPGPLAKIRVQELLLWWDRKVFGANRDIPRSRETVGSSSVARLASQRISYEASASTRASATRTA